MRSAKHNMVHCLKCNKPQVCISVHLRRVCMKRNTPEERATELQKMKSSSRKWVRESRTWDYKFLCRIVPHKPSRLALLKEFLERGFLVNNQPHEADLDLADAPASTSATATASTSEPDSSNQSSPSSSDRDGGPSDPTWQKNPPAVTTSVRVKMRAAGLYNKFSDDTELIVDFKKFLFEDLNVPNCRQEVDNVSRFLRYMQPTGDVPTLDFLKKSTETRDFFQALKRTDMTALTVLNYIKGILRFVDYLKTRLDLDVTNSELRNQCQAYSELVQTLRKLISKSHEDAINTKYEQLVEDTRSVRECQEVLRVARADFLHTFGRFVPKDGEVSEEVSNTEKTTYRYYCEAIMVLRHFQCPGAVEGMTVREWIERRPTDGMFVIGVGAHETATTQVAAFAVTQEEDAWFQTYYEHIRPAYIDALDPCDRFFITSKGKPVHSVTSDLSRLQDSYKVKHATSHEVRRAAKTESNVTFTTRQKKGVARYMAHSTAAAKAHDGMLVPEAVVETSVLLGKLSGYSAERDVPSSVKHFDEFIASFPVTNDGKPPTKRQRIDAGFPDNRTFYDKWRGDQYAKRTQYLLSQFKPRKPSARRVSRLIEEEGWKANRPTAEEILQIWKLAFREEIEGDKQVLKSVATQKWKGVSIKSFGGEKGLGVVATRPFSKGDIVCDYHGEVITADEGNKKMESLENQPGYMFFFKSGDRALCIDAHTHPCKCHANVETVGRRINHSCKKPNLKPLQCVLKVDGEDTCVILFKTLRDIKVDEELRFDYGVQRTSFSGDDLEWLDE
ncbi:uncharacterized protein LOC142949895 [Anarhichas minor]|uniref:uncharacterized protein LOC142949895 n=1 Tax=Anarhichas minor TaxID=65739 RepID=UPI003F7335CC